MTLIELNDRIGAIVIEQHKPKSNEEFLKITNEAVLYVLGLIVDATSDHVIQAALSEYQDIRYNPDDTPEPVEDPISVA